MTLPLNPSSFCLNNIYAVPSMYRNLLSIAQFWHDNHVLCTFGAYNFSSLILPLVLSYIWVQYKDGLYKIPIILTHLHDLSVVDNSLFLWHHHLDHPSTKIKSYQDSHNYDCISDTNCMRSFLNYYLKA